MVGQNTALLYSRSTFSSDEWNNYVLFFPNNQILNNRTHKFKHPNPYLCDLGGLDHCSGSECDQFQRRPSSDTSGALGVGSSSDAQGYMLVSSNWISRNLSPWGEKQTNCPDVQKIITWVFMRERMKHKSTPSRDEWVWFLV